MPEKIFEWKGYSWMNGQPWGVTHTKPNQLWYADANEAKLNQTDVVIYQHLRILNMVTLSFPTYYQ